MRSLSIPLDGLSETLMKISLQKELGTSMRSLILSAVPLHILYRILVKILAKIW